MLGAPECCRFTDSIEAYSLQIKQDVDVWSIGCVLSEAAIWVVGGFCSLQEYRRRRKMETESIPLLKDCDCFHNGENPLAVVLDLHRTLPYECRTSDYVTAVALSKIIKETLVASEARPTARFLYQRSQQILESAETKLGKSIGNRSSLGIHSRQGSRDVTYDRPKTPPQVPDGYYQPRPRTPQHFDSPNYRYASSPDSMTSPQTENDPSLYNFTPPTRVVHRRSQQSPKVSMNGRYSKAQRESFDHSTHRDEDPPMDLFLEPNSSERDIMPYDTSRAFNNLMSSSRNGLQDLQPGDPRWQKSAAATAPFEKDRHANGTDTTHIHHASRSAREVVENIGEGNKKPHLRLGNTPSDSPEELPLGLLSPGRNQVNASHGMISKSPKQSPPPYLSISDAKKWKIAKKNREKPVLPSANLLDNLNDRDHVSCATSHEDRLIH